jgi:thiamine pyrophosphokinase
MMHYKSILCLNGDLPSKNFFNKSLPIIAADGAADKLHAMGINPDVVIGDLDSIKNAEQFNLIHAPHQDESDFQKALKHIKECKLLPCLVLGAGGGFMDHVLFNIDVIMRNECIFYSPPIIGIPLNKTVKFKLKLNSKVSIFAMPKVKISTSGLKWELNDSVLEFPGFNSLSNVNVKENFTVEVKEGKALLMAYVDKMEDICIDYV